MSVYSEATGVYKSGSEIWVVGRIDNQAALWHYAPDAAVPEPGSMLALFSGLVPVGIMLRRRK